MLQISELRKFDVNFKTSQILPQFFAQNLKCCKVKERHKLKTIANFKMTDVGHVCDLSNVLEK